VGQPISVARSAGKKMLKKKQEQAKSKAPIVYPLIYNPKQPAYVVTSNGKGIIDRLKALWKRINSEDKVSDK
jgi:hypothetical protein